MFEVFGNTLFSDLNRMRREMDALFTAPQQRSGIRAAQATPAPSISVGETHEDVRVYAFAPGLEKNTLDVTIQGNLLRISGKYSEKPERNTAARKEQQITRYRSERPSGSFSRLVTLPESVNAQQVHAHYENGILEVLVAKKPEVKPQRIDVTF